MRATAREAATEPVEPVPVVAVRARVTAVLAGAPATSPRNWLRCAGDTPGPEPGSAPIDVEINAAALIETTRRPVVEASVLLVRVKLGVTDAVDATTNLAMPDVQKFVRLSWLLMTVKLLLR